MGLETATYIHELDSDNPVGASDPKSQGDDHLRMLKLTLQNTLPNIEGVVNASHTELNILVGATVSSAELNKLDGVTVTTAEINYLGGVTSAIQTQINTKLATNGDGSNLTNLNASNIASGTLATSQLPSALAAVGQVRTFGNIIDIEGNASGTIFVMGSTNVEIRVGTGSPVGAINAPVGSLFLRSDGGAGSSFYVKEGAAITDWSAK